jgi:hypothetical protein
MTRYVGEYFGLKDFVKVKVLSKPELLQTQNLPMLIVELMQQLGHILSL